MITRALVPLIALGAAPPPADTITLTMAGWGATTQVRVDPGGQVAIDVDRPDPSDPTGVRKAHDHHDLDVGFTGYRRIVALVEPVRRWAGGSVPCAATIESDIGKSLSIPVERIPPAVVHWAAYGSETRVDLGCSAGPALNEIELVRAAIDTIKTWAREEPPAPVDPAANVIEKDIILGNDR